MQAGEILNGVSGQTGAAGSAVRSDAGTLSRTERALLPYSGDRAAEHRAGGGQPFSSRVYASDTSGTKTYCFNASGYRGEELDASASLRVFVCGASYAFGTGLDWEETWAFRLKTRLADELGLGHSSVNLLNFSQSLASASYVTRTLMTQCDAVRPDLVVAVFSDMKRAECFVDGASAGIVPRRYPWYRRWWALRPGWQRRLRRMLPGAESRSIAGERLRLWNHYAGLFSPEAAFVNTLTNILLLQSFCQARRINCLISWVQHRNLRDPRFLENPLIAPSIRLLDGQKFCSFSIVDADICTDKAADGIHPGAASNAAFAERLVPLYMRMRAMSAAPRTEAQ